jgi:5-methylcytosine-specific restriction endonuclease McrA
MSQVWGGRRAVRLRMMTLGEYGTVCWLCGRDGADSADHVLPRSRGGSDALENLRPAHRACNSARGNRVGSARPPARDGSGWFAAPTAGVDVTTSGGSFKP